MSVTSEWSRVKVLGSGAFGTVEVWENNNQRIAIKKCHINKKSLTDKQKERWENEVNVMNKLNHKNLINTRDLPQQFICYNNKVNDLPILCMEFCTKGDLRSLLNNCENCCGIKGTEALKIMRDISSAVEYLHGNKITHRDLKPENIVLQQIGSNIIYKLIDLGYAKELSDASISASIVGTLNYLAPELLWKESYSCSVDYWSLGILFYEIITGTRPFLPHMQITKTWIDVISKKKYQDISAREVNNKIIFNSDIDDPCTIPKCIKNDLVEWFRLVLQWDPRKRGKIADQIVVFTKLNEILSKKIVEVFIVPLYKFESFVVDPDVTVDKIKLLIFHKELIGIQSQIVTDTMGNILDDKFSLHGSDVIIVFNDDLCIDNASKPKFYKYINQVIVQPRKQVSYHEIKYYYGSMMFFIRQQIEIYRNYILALSIMIDLCDKKLESLRNDIQKLSSGVEKLVSSLESTEELIKNTSYECSFKELKKKISNFVEGKKKMKKQFDGLVKDSERLRNFSDVNWMQDIEEPLDHAYHLIKTWLIADRNKSRSPLDMVQLFHKFLSIRESKLRDQQLTDAKNDITQFSKQLSLLKAVLKSFNALLINYNEELNKIRQEVNSLNETSPTCSGVINIPANETDAVIFNSILISNMLGGLLTEMDLLKTKYADLNNLDN
ncbi:inhibitor of nuclear factor kappa-B kinase subunit alpha isoform X1 [Microplitis demolitor]|uniref:inhibitor of nuclear factor kappa-B kinase subunit alpha isoform X1 n=1 Tax=Microplitis demolitor TaxID=69319 RepID=UPI0004CD0F0D|nr:inhibitor of nuclear factor kappa-B kinase subunit alpha isoform X1 [Microplitis demolitor]